FYIHATVPIEVAAGLKTVTYVSTGEEPLSGRIIAGKNTNGDGSEVFLLFLGEVVGVSGCETKPPVWRRHELPFDISTQSETGLIRQISNRQADIHPCFYPRISRCDFGSTLLSVHVRRDRHHRRNNKKSI